MAPSLSSRIKVMANLDIVDRHRAQDGQIRHETEGRQVDIRVSTAETIWGEKVVLRLLDQGRTVISLDQLGLEADGYGTMSRLLRSPFGMLVVSGPTGSGKTTTLYAAIHALTRSARTSRPSRTRSSTRSRTSTRSRSARWPTCRSPTACEPSCARTPT